jgi:hypothetical protein
MTIPGFDGSRALAPRARVGTAALVALSILGGCTQTIGPSSGPSASVGPSSAVGASNSPAGGGSGPPSQPPRELTASPAPLPAGTYTFGAFKPTVTLDVDGSWTSVNRFDDFFDVEQDVGSPDVISVQVARPAAFVGRSGTSAVPSDPGSAVEIVRSNPGLRVVEESETRMGGLTGRQVTVENASGHVVGVMVVGSGTPSIDTGRRLWMAFFATQDGLVAILVGGSTASWDRALEKAEPVLESIRIGI